MGSAVCPGQGAGRSGDTGPRSLVSPVSACFTHLVQASRARLSGLQTRETVVYMEHKEERLKTWRDNVGEPQCVFAKCCEFVYL